MKREILFVQQISLKADNFYSDGERFGKWAKLAFGNSRSQIRGLESIANSSLKVADILDYIKKQTGKQKAREQWRKLQGNQEFGPALLNFISDSLRTKRDEVCVVISALPNQAVVDELEKQRIFLALIREFIRQVSAQYELEVTS